MPTNTGDNVTFTCNLASQGRPRAQGYRWRLGGREVKDERSERLSVTLTDSLAGQTNVSCRAFNQAGQGEAGWLDMEVMTGPSLAVSLPALTSTREDQSLQLVCQVACLPGCELRWYREGRLLKHSDKRFFINKTISYQNNKKYYR